MRSLRKYNIIAVVVLILPIFDSAVIFAVPSISRPILVETNGHSIGCDFSSANPAAFIVDGRACVSLSVCPSPFGIQELSSSELYFGYSISDRIAVSADVCGSSCVLYSCLGPRAAAKYAVTDDFTLGIAAGLSYQRFKDYGTDASGYFDVGSVVSITESLSAGISINKLGSGERSERLSGAFSLSYYYSAWLCCSLGSKTELGAETSYFSEFIFILPENISIGAGFGTDPSVYGVRFGFELSSFTFAFRAYSTKDLGWRYSSGIGYTFAR